MGHFASHMQTTHQPAALFIICFPIIAASPQWQISNLGTHHLHRFNTVID